MVEEEKKISERRRIYMAGLGSINVSLTFFFGHTAEEGEEEEDLRSSESWVGGCPAV